MLIDVMPLFFGIAFYNLIKSSLLKRSIAFDLSMALITGYFIMYYHFMLGAY